MAEIDQGEVGEDEGVALDGAEPGASGFGKIAKIGVLGDGSLKPERAEMLALAHADGFRGLEAWRVSGEGALSYRQRITASPVFRERVEVLVAEREKIEALGVEGEVLWAAKQNWRLARAGGVVAEIHRATVLFVETSRAFLGVAPAADGSAAPAPEGETPRGPGRPAHQPRQIRVDVEQMRMNLIQKGVGVAPPAAVQ